jgi:hypothetical protein
MSSIRDYFKEEIEKLDAPQILFVECFGEHVFTDTIRQAVCYAATQKFQPEDINSSDFTEADEVLGASIRFYGPITDIEEAISLSSELPGVIVAPTHMWTTGSEFVYVAVLQN